MKVGCLATLYVFFLIRHERRELIHFNITASPTAAWIGHQLLEATPWDRHPKYLIHDRDAVYGTDFHDKLASRGMRWIQVDPAGGGTAISLSQCRRAACAASSPHNRSASRLRGSSGKGCRVRGPANAAAMVF